MRLTSRQIEIITEVVFRNAGEEAVVYLFGSRLNDQARGGDVDILIEMDQQLSWLERARIKMELEQALGLPVDILVRVRNAEPTPFQIIAQAHAVRLEGSP